MIGVPILLGGMMQSAVTPARPTYSTERHPIEAIVVHPFVRAMFTCADHSASEKMDLGDALGTDCSVQDSLAKQGQSRGFLRFYRTDGLRNEDWFGWRRPVLAPFAGKVVRIHENKIDNRPGTLGKPPAGFTVFERGDGVRVIYAHLMEFKVKAGDSVAAGQEVARIGNNGPSWAPHVHIGAWKGKLPMQIRFDQIAMGER